MSSQPDENYSQLYDQGLTPKNDAPAFWTVWEILKLAIFDKITLITWSRSRYKLQASVKCDEHEMIPPSYHLLGQIFRILRQLGWNTSKNDNSIFRFTYRESAGEQRGELRIQYNGQSDNDMVAELLSNLNRISDQQLRRQSKKDQLQQRYTRRIQLGTAFGILVPLVTIVGLVTAIILLR